MVAKALFSPSCSLRSFHHSSGFCPRLLPVDLSSSVSLCVWSDAFQPHSPLYSHIQILPVHCDLISAPGTLLLQPLWPGSAVTSLLLKPGPLAVLHSIWRWQAHLLNVLFALDTHALPAFLADFPSLRPWNVVFLRVPPSPASLLIHDARGAWPAQGAPSASRYVCKSSCWLHIQAIYSKVFWSLIRKEQTFFVGLHFSNYKWCIIATGVHWGEKTIIAYFRTNMAIR